MSSVLEAIQTIRDLSDNEEHTKIADSLESQHQSALLKHGDYRSIVENDKALMWEHLDRMNDVEPMELVTCRNCNMKPEFVQVGSKSGTVFNSSCRYSTGHSARVIGSCSISKASLPKLNELLSRL